jgi:myo-inositol-1(or 4)-monophosphatase
MKKEYPDSAYLYDLALRAGRVMVRNFGNVLRNIKKDGTPITPTDKAIHRLVIESISEDFPGVEIIGEEGGRKVDGAKYGVTFDPMDGTIPFLIGLPISTFCISIIEIDQDIPLMALIYDPFSRRMWQAIRGQGTFIDGRKAKVSEHGLIKGSTMGVFWWKDSLYHLDRAQAELQNAGADCFNPLSVALLGGLVASGRMEATIFPGRHTWETAAMQLMVKEAGGKATDIHGKEICYHDNAVDGHIISNGLIHEELVAMVANCQ